MRCGFWALLSLFCSYFVGLGSGINILRLMTDLFGLDLIFILSITSNNYIIHFYTQKAPHNPSFSPTNFNLLFIENLPE